MTVMPRVSAGAGPAVPRPGRWERIVAPSPRLVDPADRARARLLAGLLAVIVVAGFLSGVIQLALVPGFVPTFVAMNLALGVLAAGYAASRTRRYRVGGAIAALAPVGACLAIAVLNPDDRVWYAFMSISVLLAAVFLSLRATAAVAALSFGGMLALAWLVPTYREPARFVPPLMFNAIFSVLLLLASAHRNDLEERRRRALLEAQAAAAQSERLDAVARLARGVAHDFNNLLAVIQASVGVLRGKVPPGTEALEDLAAAADRSAALVRQLLAFSRQQGQALRVISPAEVVGALEGLLRRLAGEGVEVAVERPERLGRVRADPSQLEQVLLNLVVNARDAMPGGGALRISFRDVAIGAEGLEIPGDLGPGPYVAIEVADTGVGMTEEVRRRVFEPYFTTKPEGRGNGIGLATVHGIVKSCGGQVAVRSALGKGSVFTVLLPRVERDSEPGSGA